MNIQNQSASVRAARSNIYRQSGEGCLGGGGSTDRIGVTGLGAPQPKHVVPFGCSSLRQ